MKKISIALTAIMGITLSSIATQVLTAQKSPAAYYVAEVEVNNQEQYNTYIAGVPKTIEKYGGHYLARGGKTVSLEGEPPKRIVVIAFNSVADAEKWYNSPEYSAIRPIRLRSAKSRGFIVEGVAQ